VACLWFTHEVLGLDSALSDNVAANLVGQPIGLVARFYLFRRLVFRRPVQLLHMNLPPEVVEEIEHPEGEPGPPAPLPDAASRERESPIRRSSCAPGRRAGAAAAAGSRRPRCGDRPRSG